MTFAPTHRLEIRIRLLVVGCALGLVGRTLGLVGPHQDGRLVLSHMSVLDSLEVDFPLAGEVVPPFFAAEWEVFVGNAFDVPVDPLDFGEAIRRAS